MWFVFILVMVAMSIVVIIIAVIHGVAVEYNGMLIGMEIL